MGLADVHAPISSQEALDGQGVGIHTTSGDSYILFASNDMGAPADRKLYDLDDRQ